MNHSESWETVAPRKKMQYLHSIVLSGYIWHIHTPTPKIHHHCQEQHLTIFLHLPQGDLLSRLSKGCHSFWAMPQTLNDSQKSVMTPESIMQTVGQHGMVRPGIGNWMQASTHRWAWSWDLTNPSRHPTHNSISCRNSYWTLEKKQTSLVWSKT